jgi:hypothetical protein
MIHAISSPSHSRIDIPQCSDLVPQFCLFLANRTSALRSGRLSSISAFRVGRRVQRDARPWESQGRRIGRSSNTLKWRSDVADGEALERDGRLLRQSVRLLGRQLLGLVWCKTISAISRSSPSPRCPRPFATPSRSFASRFWLIFHLPSSRVIVKRNPTMPRNITSM